MLVLMTSILFSQRRCIPEAVVVRVKARAFKEKRWQRLDPAGGRWGIFGLHTVPETAKEVVLTEVSIEGDGVTAIWTFSSGCLGLLLM